MKLRFILILVLFLLVGCSSKQTTDPQNIPENTVLVQDFKFTPLELTVPLNAKVTWQQKDSAPHVIISTNNFESQTLNQNKEFSYTFTKLGIYDYYCKIHPSMKGKIIVQNV